MSRKREHPRRRRPTPRFRGTSRDESLVTIFCNPVYGYGRWLEPKEVAAAHVFIRDVELAEKQEALGRTLTLDELDAEFTALMDDLVAGGLCRRMQDLPPIVSKTTWLLAHQELIYRLMEGEEL
jgi:hypothetical protein